MIENEGSISPRLPGTHGSDLRFNAQSNQMQNCTRIFASKN
jgi:hypothetical protein